MLNGALGAINTALARFSPIQLIVGTMGFNFLYNFYYADKKQWLKDGQANLYHLLKSNYFTKDFFAKEVAKELDPILDDIDYSLHKHRTVFYKEMPERGISQDKLLETIRDICKMDGYGDQVSGAIYKGSRFDLEKFVGEIFEIGGYTNPLHPDLFENLRQCENEVVKWCSDLMNAGAEDEVMGCVNSGGTESIMEAVYAHKKWALNEKQGLSRRHRLNIVIPSTAHVAFEKAAEKYEIDCIRVDVDSKTGKVDIDKMRKAVNRNTIMIAGSAPNYPHGVIDDMSGLAKIAREVKCGLHVDACLGGFLIAFMEKCGVDLPLFDFRLPEVTSISMDTHKYGYVPKGSSVCAMRKSVGKYQSDFRTRWSGGLYSTPSSAGSRPGAMILATWAVLAHIGIQNYVQATRDIIQTKNQFVKMLQAYDDIEILGDPELSVVAFKLKKAPENATYLLLDKLEEKGWKLNGLQNPAAMHFCFTLKQAESQNFIKRFSKDLEEAIRYVKEHPNEKSAGAGAQYGGLKKIPAVIAHQLEQHLGREYAFLDSRIGVSRPNAMSRIQEDQSKQKPRR